MSRFTIGQASRRPVPLLVGVCGPSSSGKTFSMLRVASGIARVCGGSIGVIDTENGRALHYADRFSFLHLPFSPPFSPEDYWEAIQVAAAAGCKTIIIDQLSHEHEGPGGVLEMHETEVERMVGSGWRPDAAQFPAWAKPKAQRRKLIQNMLQLNVNLICGFRAKRKVKIEKTERNGRTRNEPVDQGWMPIAGDEYAYEMTALAVLPPGSKGVPDWLTQDPGSELVRKCPKQFEGILKAGAQLSEDMGEAMARWAAGDAAPAQAAPNSAADDRFNELLALIEMSDTRAKLEATKAIANKTTGLNKTEKERLRVAFAAAEHRLSASANPENDGRIT